MQLLLNRSTAHMDFTCVIRFKWLTNKNVLEILFCICKEELITVLPLPKFCLVSGQAIIIFASLFNAGTFLGVQCVPLLFFFFSPFYNEDEFCVQFRPVLV